MSYGIEDLVAVGKKGKLFVQAKNHKTNPGLALSQIGKEILRRHALEHGAIPVFLYKARRGENIWINLATNREIKWLKPYTKEWLSNRSEIKKKLRELKDPKKGGSTEKWETYVLEHYEQVKDFIC